MVRIYVHPTELVSVELSYRKIPKINPSKHKPLKIVTQKTLR